MFQLVISEKSSHEVNGSREWVQPWRLARCLKVSSLSAPNLGVGTDPRAFGDVEVVAGLLVQAL